MEQLPGQEDGEPEEEEAKLVSNHFARSIFAELSWFCRQLGQVAYDPDMVLKCKVEEWC